MTERQVSEAHRLVDTLTAWDIAYRRLRGRGSDRLASAGDPLDTVFVPVTATILVARQTALDPVPLSVGLVGPEGLAGWQALLRIDRWTHDAIVLTPGEIVAVRVADIDAACADDPDRHALLLRVVHNHTLQLAQSVVANLGHSVDRRLSRWLLMLHDRVPGGAIAITHEQLSQVLNVRRATVTDALHMLEGDRLIRNLRGRIEVRDRPALVVRAGQSYGLSEDDYRAAIGPFGRCLAQQQA